MCIANELSSEVAAAVFARKSDAAQAETKELVEIVRDFHSEMRHLMSEERRHRVAHLPAPQASGQAASGSN